MKKLLRRISDRLPCRIISDNQRPYLERYYLTTFWGVRVYLHRFVGSDPDRGLHDHPWAWALSILLSGWYIEETRRHPNGAPVRWLNWLLGDSFHRVVMPVGQREVWTLFAHRAGDVKHWGFLNAIDNIATDDALIWTGFKYASGKGRWWETAPMGRDCPGRLPEDGR